MNSAASNLLSSLKPANILHLFHFSSWHSGKMGKPRNLTKSQILALLVLSYVTLANDLTSLVLSLKGSWESHLNFPCLNFCAAFCVVDWAPPPSPPFPSKSTICIILQRSRENYFADFSSMISG